MAALRAWLGAARLLVQANVAAALLFGQALAFAATGSFSWRIFALVQVFGGLAALFVVFTGHVADLQIGADNGEYRRLAGGWQAVDSGLSGLNMAQAALGLSLAMGAVGVWLSLRERRAFALVVVACTVLLPWATDFPPFKFAQRGGGGVAQGLWLGGVLPLFAFYMQARHLAPLDWRSLVPALAVAYAIAVTGSLAHLGADRAAGKHGYAARRGRKTARRTVLVFLAVGIVTAPFAIHVRLLPLTLLMVIAPAALWVSCATRSRKGDRDLPFITRAVATADVALLSWAAGMFLR